MQIILDTNALMVPEQFGVDIFGELARLGYVAWIVPRSVKRELAFLADRADKGADKVAARIALGLAEHCLAANEDAAEANVDADTAIERLAQSSGAAVFTNDKALKKRLFSKGITVIYLRQGRYLETTKKEY